MPDYKKLWLIATSVYISELHESELQYICQRFNNNSTPDFTDQKLVTIYLFIISEQEYFKLSQIHRFAKEFMNCLSVLFSRIVTAKDKPDRFSIYCHL